MKLDRKADIVVGVNLGDIGAYVGLAGMLALEREFAIEVQWLPIAGGLQRLSSQMPVSATDDPLSAYKARRAQARAAWAHAELERNCDSLGIPLAAGGREFDPALLNLGLLYLSGKPVSARDYIERAFAAAFRQGGEVEKVTLVAGLVGDPAFEAFATGEGPSKQESLQEQLLDAGIFNSPAFLYRGEVFQGRQHLPLIRWYLGGEQGPPPV